MTGGEESQGFTLVETIVTTIVMSIFLALFFQLFFVTESQRITSIRLAKAHDIAKTNLSKVVEKSAILGINPLAACGSDNNLEQNINAFGSNEVGTFLASDKTNDPSWSSAFKKEEISGTGLPSSTTQSLIVTYPKGCDAAMPAKITSIVEYGDEKVVHANYVR